MPDTMIFIIQTINMILRAEGPMDRVTLIRRVGEQMQLGDLIPYVDSTLNVLIGNNKVLVDEEGKLYTRSR